jgi:hypothetical protein
MTAEIIGTAAATEPWALLDELIGIRAAKVSAEKMVTPSAFYGRCSTEDNPGSEDVPRVAARERPEVHRPARRDDRRGVLRHRTVRSVTWDRRRAGSQLLAALKDPARTWNAVVVGEGTRCWFGNQFLADRATVRGVRRRVVGSGTRDGKYDPRNPSHKMLMSVLGGMSESERQHVQARVRAAMDSQVLNEGRHQGGRAPCGYSVVDAGPHPNPRKAVEGFRLRVLAVDEPSAAVVRRIFAEYLDGNGDRAIAGGLNRDGVPCPSARRPDQNRHRLARRLAGQHGARDPRQSPVHRVRGVRPVDAGERGSRTRTTSRPDT